jgi:hypothetical protein
MSKWFGRAKEYKYLRTVSTYARQRECVRNADAKSVSFTESDSISITEPVAESESISITEPVAESDSISITEPVAESDSIAESFAHTFTNTYPDD